VRATWPGLVSGLVDRRSGTGIPCAPSVSRNLPIPLAVRGVTDVGRRRDHNEDAFLVDPEAGLFVVADGMGGHAGGGTASSIAVETIRSQIRSARAAEPALFRADMAEQAVRVTEVLRLAVEAACRDIFRAGSEDPSLAGMGTTVTAVVVAGRGAYVAHVGDSRCYLCRGGRIFQISEDHSLVNEQLKAGAITEEEARSSRFRNIITRSVGFEEEVEVDVLGFELAPGDQLVLCCDGLSNLVEDDEILRTVTDEPLSRSPEYLVGLANDRGGDDNITVIVVRVDGEKKA
jgi:serine/threonine protein phosphatase PrpC